MSSYEPYAKVSTEELGGILGKKIKKLQRAELKKRAEGGDDRAREFLEGASGKKPAAKTSQKTDGKRERGEGQDVDVDVNAGGGEKTMKQVKQPPKISIKGNVETTTKQQRKNQRPEVVDSYLASVLSTIDYGDPGPTCRKEVQSTTRTEKNDPATKEHSKTTEDHASNSDVRGEDPPMAMPPTEPKQFNVVAECEADLPRLDSNGDQHVMSTVMSRTTACEESTEATAAEGDAGSELLRAARMESLELQAECLWGELAELRSKRRQATQKG